MLGPPGEFFNFLHYHINAQASHISWMKPEHLWLRMVTLQMARNWTTQITITQENSGKTTTNGVEMEKGWEAGDGNEELGRLGFKSPKLNGHTGQDCRSRCARWLSSTAPLPTSHHCPRPPPGALYLGSVLGPTFEVSVTHLRVSKGDQGTEGAGNDVTSELLNPPKKKQKQITFHMFEGL